MGRQTEGQMVKKNSTFGHAEPALPSAQQKVNWKPWLFRQTGLAEEDQIGGTKRGAEVSAIKKLFRLMWKITLFLEKYQFEII